MRDEGQVGEPVQDTAENETRHGDHRIERPAEHLLDIECDVVIEAWTVGIEIRMDPDRPLLAGHELKERQQRRVVQETPASIGVDEDAPHAELSETALGLIDGRLDIMHGYHTDRDDAIWIAIGHVQDRVVRGNRQLRR